VTEAFIKIKKNRLDAEMVARGLIASLEKAKALIMAGDVLVNQQVIYKADFNVTPDHQIQLKEKFPYASRGALKLENAFTHFNIDVTNRNVLDIGISNGGFSDYMLQKGARSVTGVDVNINQVEAKLKNNPRVTLIKANARTLTASQLEIPPQLITIDVSFISITRILPQLSAFPDAVIVSLIKPQFEAFAADVDRGGIVRDKNKRMQTLLRLKEQVEHLNYGVTGFTSSGVKGRKGNLEYFFLLEYGKKSSINDTIVTDLIEHEDET